MLPCRMLPLKNVNFFIRGKIYVNLEAHKRKKKLIDEMDQQCKNMKLQHDANSFWNVFLNLESIGNRGQ